MLVEPRGSRAIRDEYLAKLLLESAIGNQIANEQTIHPGLLPEDKDYKNFLEEFERKWKGLQCTLRPGAMLRYNCHGLTFGSRRTWIDDREAVSRILSDDGYSEIKAIGDVLPGDVVVYFDERGRPDHSGIVVEPSSSLGIPKVISKWAWFFEVVHWANQHPYAMSDVRYFRILKNTVKPDQVALIT